MSAALIAEFNRAFIAAMPRRPALERWMLAQGVPASVARIQDMRFTQARIEPNDGYFEFADDGAAGLKQRGGGPTQIKAIIVPEGARAPRWEGDIEIMCWATMADMVAFDIDDPSRWWRRRGAIDVLGQGALCDARVCPDMDDLFAARERLGKRRLSAAHARRMAMPPLRLFSTPLSWLAGGAEGCCLVDRDIDPRHVFAGVGRVACENAALAHHVQRRIDRYAALAQPEISVMGSSRPKADSPSQSVGPGRPKADSPSQSVGSSRPKADSPNSGQVAA